MFSGPQYKGAMRDYRKLKREEAEQRNAPGKREKSKK
jgi:hypothetical protein